MNVVIIIQTSTSAQVSGELAPSAPGFQWVPVAALVVSAITLGTILFFRWRDSRAILKISYSVGEPENPTDILSIPEGERTEEPALYIKIFNNGKANVRLNNAFIELKRGKIAFQKLGNFHTKEVITSLKQPGDHWFVYQRMFELSRLLQEQGCGGITRFKFVVRDWSGRLHKKTIKIEDVEHWATLYGPQTETERPRQSRWQKWFGRC